MPKKDVKKVFKDLENVEMESKRLEQEWEQERQNYIEKNKNNPPRPPEWEYADPFTGEPTACGIPICPNCNEPLYEMEYCCFCGQPILLDSENDAELREYIKPPETGIMICIQCGQKTMEYTVSKYNGHRHGKCTNCNAIFME